MTTLLCVAFILHSNRGKIPKNKFVRLLFNPATETEGGATLPIENNCLVDIEEVYGFHNEPTFDEGDIRIHGGRHPEQIAHVIQICEEYFGEEHFQIENMPFAGCKGFSKYLNKTPGCYFALGTMKEGEELIKLRSPKYDYNDDMIPTGVYFFLRLIELRLGITILPPEHKKSDLKATIEEAAVKKK